MYFIYNGVTVGNNPTSDGIKVIAGEGEGNRKWASERMETWNEGQVIIYFRVVKDTAALLFAYEDTIFHKTTGLLRLSQKLSMVYPDGSTRTYDPAPTAADPSAVQQTPRLEKVASAFNTSTSQVYKYTLTFEPPCHFNNVKINQIKVDRDAFGYMTVTTSGIVPKAYVNGMHDALESFKKYYTANVEKAVLNTWLGEAYYKRMTMTITSNQGLNGLSDPAGAPWESTGFTATYKQVAFSEEVKTFVSDHIFDGIFRFKQLAEVGYSIDLPTPTPGKGFSAPIPKVKTKEDAFKKIAINYFCGVKLDSSYLGGKGTGKAENYVKTKGVKYKPKGLPSIYYDVVRPNILGILKDMFGFEDVIMYGEEVEYTSAPSISVSAIVIQSSSKQAVYSERFSQVLSNGTTQPIIGGKDFGTAKFLIPKNMKGILTREIITTTPSSIPSRSIPESWFVENSTSDLMGSGGQYKSTSKGLIIFEPVFRVIETYHLTYCDSGASRQTSLLEAKK